MGIGREVAISYTISRDVAITGRRNLNQRRERTYPNVVKRPRHNSYHVKKPGDHGQRHSASPAISLVNLPKPQVAA